ncbi:MAG: hypothetical protein K6G83_12010 [Lachnospiraceae bacterium]|nr:hypothetical protein [Lachnospiraceae bacterium]
MEDWDRRAYGSRMYHEEREDPGEARTRRLKKAAVVTLILTAFIFTGGVIAAILLNFPGAEKQKEDQTEQQTPVPSAAPVVTPVLESEAEAVPEAPEEDPQEQLSRTMETGAALDFHTLKEMSAGESDPPAYGIDVAGYQGIINWQEVAAAGVDFAMIRVGYRTMGNGVITEDVNARYNLQEAAKYGIKTGAYFFSTAVNEGEALDEAMFVLDLIAPYPVTYPVAYHCEGFQDEASRHHDVTAERRTKIAGTFLNCIFLHGYTPMFYAAKDELKNGLCWDTEILREEGYKLWVAWYPGASYPAGEGIDPAGETAMWQYTGNGAVPGIPRSAAIDIASFRADE